MRLRSQKIGKKTKSRWEEDEEDIAA